MPIRNKAKNRRRTAGWIGTRVTVCGATLHTEDDLICLLPPAHNPDIPHSSIGINEQNQPVLVIQREDHIQWLSVPSHAG